MSVATPSFTEAPISLLVAGMSERQPTFASSEFGPAISALIASTSGVPLFFILRVTSWRSTVPSLSISIKKSFMFISTTGTVVGFVVVGFAGVSFAVVSFPDVSFAEVSFALAASFA